MLKPDPLGAKHEVSGFDCRDDSLNQWLIHHARAAEHHGTSRTFVTVEAGRVVGFYALAAGQVLPSDATDRLRKGQPMARPLPVVLLARLAVDVQHRAGASGAPFYKTRFSDAQASLSRSVFGR